MTSASLSAALNYCSANDFEHIPSSAMFHNQVLLFSIRGADKVLSCYLFILHSKIQFDFSSRGTDLSGSLYCHAQLRSQFCT